MSNGGIVKKVFLGKPDRRRKAGRPKLRWIECNESDLQSIGAKEIKEESGR
jgi:hypothetical protein